MPIESAIAKAFRMTDEVWARHANPWSVYTRIPSLIPLVLAVWSRVWIGWWALAPVGAVVLWIWLNPRLFPPPRSTDNWASKGVLGERVWLERRRLDLPRHHRVFPSLLAGLSAAGLPFLVWGLWRLEVWPTVVGTILVMGCKLWFVDRMVWLFEEMKDADPRFRRWLDREGEDTGGG